MNKIKKLICLSIFLFISFSAFSSNEEVEKFKRFCPHLENWESIKIPNEKINTYEELQTYWQNDKRTSEQFFKAAYFSIINAIDNDDVVFLAIDLMPTAMKNYKNTKNLLEYAVNRNINYKQPLKGNGWSYSGKAGDKMAGIVEDLTAIYNANNLNDDSIRLIENVLKAQDNDINDNLLELLALNHAQAYRQKGDINKAISILDNGIEKYNGARKQWLIDTKETYTKEL